VQHTADSLQYMRLIIIRKYTADKNTRNTLMGWNNTTAPDSPRERHRELIAYQTRVCHKIP